MSNIGLPSTAEYIEIDGVSGWLYDIRTEQGMLFTFFMFQKSDGWHVMLGSPDLSDLPSQHRQHILPSGEIPFAITPTGQDDAFALSAAWATDPNVALAATQSQHSSKVSPELVDAQPSGSPLAIIPDADLLTKKVKQEILGQDEAVRLLCQTVCEHIAKVAPQHPLVLVAVGPTGTGKSESIQVLVNALNALYPNIDYGMVRINLSQYKEEYRISELFGSPPGYVGYDTKTNLVAALSKSPRQIILWDELEKAHPRVITALLSLLDNGSLILPAPLEDGTYEIDCRQSIHVFSTNLQWQAIYKILLPKNEFGNADRVNAVCARAFVEAGEVSELVGRFRQFLFYKPLDEMTLRAIAEQSVRKLAREYGLELYSCDPAIISLILRQEREESLGARPIQALVNRLIAPLLVAAIKQGVRGSVRIRQRVDKITIEQSVTSS